MGFRGGASGAGTSVAFAPPGESIDVGDTTSEGVSNRLPRADHRHAVPPPADVDAAGVGPVTATGVETAPARVDHVHGHSAAMHLGGGHADLTAILGSIANRVSTGAIAAAATADVVVPIDPALPDANYTVEASVEEATAGDTLRVRKIVSRAPNQVVVRVVNSDALNARTGTVHVLIRHDSQNPGIPTFVELPPAADAVRYVSTEGDDANDGRSVGSPKATIQAAIDALPAGGGTVQIGAGVFVVAEQTPANLTNYQRAGLIVGSNVTLRGQGRATEITAPAIPAGAGESWLTAITNADPLGGNSHIVLRDLAIVLPPPIETATGMERYDAACHFQGVSNARIEGCYIRNGGVDFMPVNGHVNTATALTAGLNTNNVITNCHLEQLTNSVMIFQATNCRFVNNKVTKAWDDVLLIGGAGTGHIIAGNYLDNSPVVANKGACNGVVLLANDGSVSATDPAVMSEIIVANNVLRGASGLNSGARAAFAVTGAARELKVVNNICTGCVSGIRVLDGSRQNILIAGNSVFANTGRGILVQANLAGSTVDGVTVVDNVIWNNVDVALDIYALGTLRIELRGNRCYDDQGVPTQTTSLNAAQDVGGTLAIRAFGNRFLNTTPVNAYGQGLGAASVLKDNAGYNPQGPVSIGVGASPFTYTAGAAPEDVFIRGGSVTDVSKGGRTLAVASPAHVHLEPGQSLIVTYSAVPTMEADRH